MTALRRSEIDAIRRGLIDLVESWVRPDPRLEREQELAKAVFRRACNDLFKPGGADLHGTPMRSTGYDRSARLFLSGKDTLLYHDILGINPDGMAKVVTRIPAM